MKLIRERREAVRLSALFILWLVGGYFGAQYAVRQWLPLYPERFLVGILIFLIAAPLTYFLLQKRGAYTRDLPYLALPLDFLIPWSLYPSLLFICLIVLPRYSLWAYGNVDQATVWSVRTMPALADGRSLTPSTCVDYIYEHENGRYEKSVCAGGRPFVAESPDNVLPVAYFPSVPQWGSLKLPALYRQLDGLIVWWAWIIAGWLLGTAVVSPQRYPPPPPAFPKTPLELLQRYDLDQFLTDEDDPALWSAVVQSHFKMPEDAKIFVPGLRFGIGEIHLTSRYLLQPIVGTRFARADKHYLVRLKFAPEAQGDHHFDPELAPRLPMRLIYIGHPRLPERPTLSIVVPRPSIDVAKVPVYTAVNYAGAAATGSTFYWLREENGRWQKSDQRVNWWYEG